jgi:3-isopropylmalate/(R)-2-methylmalate dehydratase small subunit
LPEDEVRNLMEVAHDPTASITIDLERQTVVGEGIEARFDFDPSAKERLLQGLDWIGMTLTLEESITQHELNRPAWLPVSTGSPTN